MDNSDYDQGVMIKVHAIRPGDLVWEQGQPVEVVEIREGVNNWHTLVFADGYQLSLDGDKTLARAERRVDTPRTVNVLDQQRTIVDLRTEVTILEAKVEARELELHECQEQHLHDLARCKKLEQQIRMQDAVINRQREELLDVSAELEAQTNLIRSIALLLA